MQLFTKNLQGVRIKPNIWVVKQFDWGNFIFDFGG